MLRFNVPLTVVRRTESDEHRHTTMAVVMPDYIAVPVGADITAGDRLERQLPNKTTWTVYVTDTNVLESPFSSSLDHTEVKYTKTPPKPDVQLSMCSLNSVETSIFEKPDLPYLADALSNGLTQKELDKFELGLDADTKGHAKDTRAAVIVKHIFEGPKPDEKFLRMLKYIYFEAPEGDRKLKSPEYTRLKEILDFRGVLQTGSGFQLGRKSETTSVSDSSSPTPVSATAPSAGTQITDGNGVGVNTLEGELQNMTEAVAAVTGPANRKVFIVRGQDQRPVDVLEKFLHFAGLEIMSWNDAEDLTGETQPDTYDVIVEAMKAAAAIIIILSPDDEARLKEEFAGTMQDFEGQPRQNVLLEAGMAFSMDRNRTILVESGSRRPISDIAGFNWVTMDGSWANRDKLIKRLKRAGAQVNQAHPDLNNHLAGPFKVT